jgi:hypothetical protein
MVVFELHSNLISDYGNYAHSFLLIGDDRIKECVEKEIRDLFFGFQKYLDRSENVA